MIITIAEMEREEMNKDKAIQLLKRLQDPEPYEPMLTKDAYDAIQMAIDALSADGDTISRKAAIDALDEYFVRIGELKRRGLNKGEKAISLDTVGVIKTLPSAQPERIKAKWLPIGIVDAVGGESAMWGDEMAYHACDNCWQQALEKDGEEILSDFCPHCGADMREVTE